MHQCLIFRSKAREEVEQEKREPARTRQASLVHDDVQGEKQPEVGDLGEEPAEKQDVCPRGLLYRIIGRSSYVTNGAVQNQNFIECQGNHMDNTVLIIHINCTSSWLYNKHCRLWEAVSFAPSK